MSAYKKFTTTDYTSMEKTTIYFRLDLFNTGTDKNFSDEKSFIVDGPEFFKNTVYYAQINQSKISIKVKATKSNTDQIKISYTSNVNLPQGFEPKIEKYLKFGFKRFLEDCRKPYCLRMPAIEM